MRYMRCLDKLDMTDTIHLKIKICVNPYHLCYLWFPAKLSFKMHSRAGTVFINLKP